MCSCALYVKLNFVWIQRYFIVAATATATATALLWMCFFSTLTRLLARLSVRSMFSSISAIGGGAFS